MSNHYHMLVRAHAEYPLGEVMCELQKSVSRRINKLAGRSNHVFGGPYRAGIVKHDADFLEILKYIYRNPVKAGIVSKVQFYDYSTLTNSQMPIAPFCENVLRALPLDILAWLNTPLDSEKEECVKKALKRSEFKIYIPRGY